MEPWLRITTLIVAGVLAVSLLQFIFSIIPPKFNFDTTPATYNWAYENVSVETSDGKELHGWFIPAATETDTTIVVGHGYPADKNNVLPYTRFLHEEYNLFFFDFRSFGASNGIITTAGLNEQKDVKAAVSWLKQEKPEQSTQVAGYGFSMSAATFLLQHERFDAIIAEASYADLGQMIDQLYFYLGPFKHVFAAPTKLYARLVFGVWPNQISPANAVTDSSTPILLIHGSDDKEIPVTHSKQIHRNIPANNSELWIVDGAGHGTTQAVNRTRYQERVHAFLRENLK